VTDCMTLPLHLEEDQEGTEKTQLDPLRAADLQA
jgi:hypothetical protein